MTLGDHGGGVRVPRLALWPDARRSQGSGEKVFVSGACSHQVAQRREVIVSAPTARFLGVRLCGFAAGFARTRRDPRFDERVLSGPDHLGLRLAG